MHIKLLKLLIALAIGYGLYYSIDSLLPSINYEELNLNLAYLSISYVIFVVFIVYRGLLRESLLPIHINKIKALYYHTTTAISKYLPGKVGILLTKVYFLNKHGVSSHRGFVISIYENIFQVSSAILAALLILFNANIYTNNSIIIYLVIGIGVIVGVILFSEPKLLLKVLNFGLSKLKRDLLELSDLCDRKNFIKKLILYIPGSIVNGLAFFLLVQSVYPIGLTHIVYMIGVWNLASVIGLLAIFAPGGIGVREGILVLMLQVVMPIEQAIVISAVSRLWTIIGDGIVYLIGLGCNIIYKRNYGNKLVNDV